VAVAVSGRTNTADGNGFLYSIRKITNRQNNYITLKKSNEQKQILLTTVYDMKVYKKKEKKEGPKEI